MIEQHANLSIFDAALGEKERIAIYNAGTIQVLSRGQALLKRAQRPPGLSLVLNGSFEVMKTDGGRGGMRFGQGDLIYEQALFDSDPSVSAVLAGEPSRALILSPTAFSTLGPHIQLAVLRHVSTVYSARILGLGRTLASTGTQRACLTNYLVGEAKR